jgi:hypothetical protein
MSSKEVAYLRGTVTVDVLNRRRMTPDDLLARQIEDSRNTVTLDRAGRPSAQNDGQHALFIEAGPSREFFGGNLVLLTQFGDAF